MARRLPPLLVLAGTLMALLMVVMVGTVPEEADATGRFKKVTKSFRTFDLINIPSGGPADIYPSEINAFGFRRGHIRDVNLILWDYSHTFPDDVDVLLVHRGVSRTIMSDVGGGTDIVNTNIILDDEAAPFLPDNTAIDHNDAWKPRNYEGIDFFPAPAPSPNAQASLTGFDGANPNGTWSLYVTDDISSAGGDIGEGWLIQITARVRR